MKAEENRLNHGSRSAGWVRTDLIRGRDSAPRCPRPKRAQSRNAGRQGFTAGDAAARRPYLAMGWHFRSPVALWQTVWNTN